MAYKKLIIYSDGGARGNPGPAAAGVIILDQAGQTVGSISEYLGELTNNQAEYRALFLGLKKAKELNAEELECYLDSELVVNQLNLKYRVKNGNIAPEFLKVWNLAQQFKKIVYNAIPREKNKTADRLVNIALDKRAKINT